MNEDLIYMNWFNKKTNYYIKKYESSLTSQEKEKMKQDAKEFNISYETALFIESINDELSYKLTKEYFSKYVLPKMNENEKKIYGVIK